jgi:hypothetical protein
MGMLAGPNSNDAGPIPQEGSAIERQPERVPTSKAHYAIVIVFSSPMQ